jgi:sirohydrochlorin cobaltochelatase
VTKEEFFDAALVLVGHGSSQNADSGAPVFQHAAELRRQRLFAQVREGFWKQEPRLGEVVSELKEPRVFIEPVFISEGFFSEDVIPKSLGFLEASSGPAGRVICQRGQSLFYCRPLGSHEGMTRVLLSRAHTVIEQFPFPRAPKPKDITLFIAGHGTEQNENSRKAVEHQVEIIRAQNLYAAVHAIFLEEEPRIADCYRLAETRNMVVVPFFISDGMHVQEDIPIMLGEPERVVRQRLEAGQATWRNPTEKRDKLIWLAPSIGTDPLITTVILERVREAAKWDRSKA